MNFDPETNYGKPAASYNTDDELIVMISSAKFYDPAYTHYGNNSRTNVVCDKCRKSNLHYAMGYLDQDFCLTCYDTIRTRISNKYNITPPCSYSTHSSSNPKKSEYFENTRQNEMAFMEISAVKRPFYDRPILTRMAIFSLKRNYNN
jgi:hypothetical protein